MKKKGKLKKGLFSNLSLKRGIGEIALIEIIIAVIVVIIVLALVGRGISRADRTTTDAICENSVALREKATAEFDITDKVQFDNIKLTLSPLLCKTYETDLKKELKKNAIEKEVVMKEIANSMKNCWDRFAEGKLPHTVSLSAPTIEKQGDYCFRCEAMTMPLILDESGKETKISIQELINYMHENKVNQKESYYDFITKHNNIPGRLGFFTKEIESYHTYEIFYSDWIGNNPNGIYLNDLENGPPQSWVFLGKPWQQLGGEVAATAATTAVAGICLVTVTATAATGGAAAPFLYLCGAGVGAGGSGVALLNVITPDCKENCGCYIITDSDGK